MDYERKLIFYISYNNLRGGYTVATKGNKQENESADIDKVILSLKSEERQKVFQCLLSISPKWVRVVEISKAIKSDYGNVVGALKGYGKRYSTTLSLMNTGLAECKKLRIGKNIITLYRVKRKKPPQKAP